MVVVIYLRRAEEKLYVAEKQFKLIAENATDIIFSTKYSRLPLLTLPPL